MRRSSVDHGQSTADADDLTGDAGGAVGEEKADRGRLIFGLRNATEGDEASHARLVDIERSDPETIRRQTGNHCLSDTPCRPGYERYSSLCHYFFTNHEAV